MTEPSFGPVGDACPRRDDAHLRFEFLPVEDVDLGGELGAEPARNCRKRDCRNAIIVYLLIVAWQDRTQWTAYSRDRNAYKALRRYFGRTFSYARTMWAIKTLEVAGLVEHRRMPPRPPAADPELGFRSTIRATPKLLEGFLVCTLADLKPVPIEPIRLKDADGRLTVYSDTAWIRGRRRDVLEQTEAISDLEITFAVPGWALTPKGLLTNGQHTLNPARRAYHRVYNGDFLHGGRFYGHFVQQLPQHARSLLLFGGCSVVELDFDYLHPSLIAAHKGLELSSDPYIIDDFPRADVKVAVQIVINAPTARSALAALRQELGCRSGHARRLIDAIRSHHPGLADAWGTGIGLRLQAVDGQMCAAIQRRMRDAGCPILSVHDSFIAPASQEQLLREAMDDVLARTKRDLAEGNLCIDLKL